MKTKRASANSTRMGYQLIARVTSGTMIDRVDMRKRGVTKNLKHVGVPEGLARFFKPVGGCNAKDC